MPHDIGASTVLDYGCNQGGFLRLLYDNRPFRSAVGIDIARESVARAELLKGQRPIEYRVADSAASLECTFDYAFSHEVIYLLPDLAAHVRAGRAARGRSPLGGGALARLAPRLMKTYLVVNPKSANGDTGKR